MDWDIVTAVLGLVVCVLLIIAAVLQFAAENKGIGGVMLFAALIISGAVMVMIAGKLRR